MKDKKKRKRILMTALIVIACWGVYVTLEGLRLVGSADPGKYPLVTMGSTQTQDEIAEYHSVGFSQVYHLTSGDTFVYGEFKVLGVRIFHWEAE